MEDALIRLWRAMDGRDPGELASQNVEECLDQRHLKRKFVLTMFDILAPGYDAFTRTFSLGMDSQWKSELIKQGARRTESEGRILDLACGTGSLGAALSREACAKQVVSVDFSQQMLLQAAQQSGIHGRSATLVACDMLQLCFADNTFDLIVVGYGIRNAADVGQALGEIRRVLKPGGLLLNLDFYKPVGKIWRSLFLWYLWNAGRLAGWLWHREPITYGYLGPSVKRYLTMPEFEELIQRTGFALEWQSSKLNGGIGLHVARLREI